MKRLPIVQYTKALFQQCQAHNTTDLVFKDLEAIGKLIQESAKFSDFLHDPTIQPSEQNVVLENIFKDKLNPATRDFISFLIKKNRLSLLEEICNSFKKFYFEAAGIIPAEIFSSIPLDQEQIQKICARFKFKLKKDIEPHLIVRPEILGGIKVKAGDVVYDYSLRFQLDKFKNSLASV